MTADVLAVLYVVKIVLFLYCLCTIKRQVSSKEDSGRALEEVEVGVRSKPTAVPMHQPAAAVAVASAMPMQQPAMTSVIVTCPPGMKPGDAVQVAGPGGQMMQVQVPMGVMAGGQFQVQVPAVPVMMAQAPPLMMAQPVAV